MGRIIGAVVAGLIAGGIMQMVVELMGHSIFPPPDSIQSGDKEALEAYIKNAPLPALIFPLIAVSIGNLCAGLIATAISKSNHIPALIIGVLFTIGSVVNIIMIPHPMWMGVLYVLAPIPMALLGYRLLAGHIQSTTNETQVSKR